MSSFTKRKSTTSPCFFLDFPLFLPQIMRTASWNGYILDMGTRGRRIVAKFAPIWMGSRAGNGKYQSGDYRRRANSSNIFAYCNNPKSLLITDVLKRGLHHFFVVSLRPGTCSRPKDCRSYLMIRSDMLPRPAEL